MLVPAEFPGIRKPQILGKNIYAALWWRTFREKRKTISFKHDFIGGFWFK